MPDRQPPSPEKASEPSEQKPEIASLFKDLTSSDHDARINASTALGKLGRDAVPALTQALNDHRGTVRYLAACALGDIGPDARAAELALNQAERDSDPDVLFAAKAALSRINPKYRTN